MTLGPGKLTNPRDDPEGWRRYDTWVWWEDVCRTVEDAFRDFRMKVVRRGKEKPEEAWLPVTFTHCDGRQVRQEGILTWENCD
jgi:hypothetical protein